jgi:N utilization substance protein A
MIRMVTVVMGELGGEKIDLVEWSADPTKFIEEALSPAKVIRVEIVDEASRFARAYVAEDQQSLAIGKGGQNVRLAVKLTGWKIDIQSAGATGETEGSEASAAAAPAKSGAAAVSSDDADTAAVPDTSADADADVADDATPAEETKAETAEEQEPATA